MLRQSKEPAHERFRIPQSAGVAYWFAVLTFRLHFDEQTVALRDHASPSAVDGHTNEVAVRLLRNTQERPIVKSFPIEVDQWSVRRQSGEHVEVSINSTLRWFRNRLTENAAESNECSGE
ncbi:hypothetical protein H7849_17140 [Alloacidobacterium dinghuense]|uniref:Uncharacterized protein n=1 Tax=Alloacidobacterium dinghuense TaxID=2763107 RepID=A0A7G8BE61_9BACT|nr:hypothetical protein [Alloacidobacterium dinghuense]QNI30831.1 hypothetical protein H7849_17140 [Alloacidobacterium dinghuense]